MHDPMTMVFEIRRLGLTIWHLDPETDGSDDSCGWFAPKPTQRDRELIEEILDWDRDNPFFMSPTITERAYVLNPDYDYLSMSIGDCSGYVAAAWELIAWMRDGRRKLRGGELQEIITLSSNPHDNLRSVLPGRDTSRVEYRAKRFLFCVLRAYLRKQRRWWQHPRWHIRHWRVQVDVLIYLKRYLWTRCAYCGERFDWRYAPVGSRWDSEGPKWFKGELYYHECYRPEFNKTKQIKPHVKP